MAQSHNLLYNRFFTQIKGTMMNKFLTQAWFDQVATLNEQAGDLHLPPTLSGLLLNVVITGDNPIQLHLKQGKIAQHLLDDAQATINIDNETLAQIIDSNDVNTALEAFMMGKIRINGDMSAVMNLQSAKPSPEQKRLYKQIKEMTVFA